MRPISLSKVPILKGLLPYIVGSYASHYIELHSYAYWAMACGACCLILALLLSPKVLGYKPQWTKAILYAGMALSIVGSSYHYVRLRGMVGSSVISTESAFRAKCIDRMTKEGISPEVQRLMAGIALGYMPRTDQVQEMRKTFARSGAAHLLAVSGFHLGVVALALGIVFRLLRLSPCSYYVLILVSIWAFAWLVGMNIPTVRSAIMLTLFLVAKLIGRGYYVPNILSCSLFIQLLLFPADVYSWGLWLSYSAVLSIYCFYPLLRTIWGVVYQPHLRGLWSAMAVSLSAQVLVLPLSLYFFGYLSWSFVFTAVPLAFLSTLMIPLSLIAYLLVYYGVSLAPILWLTEEIGRAILSITYWGSCLDSLVWRGHLPLWGVIIYMVVILGLRYYFSPEIKYKRQETNALAREQDRILSSDY